MLYSSFGEAMTDVCQDFGISRKTGYKIFDHYKEHGLSALGDRSRRPVHYANQLPQQVESLIVRLKAEKPHWGARKIRELSSSRWRPTRRSLVAPVTQAPTKYELVINLKAARHSALKCRQRCSPGGRRGDRVSNCDFVPARSLIDFAGWRFSGCAMAWTARRQ